MNDYRWKKWQPIEAGAVIPAGQPHRVIGAVQTWERDKVAGPGTVVDADWDPDVADFPQTPETAQTCVHGNRVWFGHECGICEEAEGGYQWS